jgi:hypothetical protein
VLGPDDKPVAGARLFTRRLLSELRWPDEVVESTDRGVTDVAGRFRFDMPKADFDPSSAGTRLAVLTVADGYGMGWAVGAKPGEAITLRLVKDVPIAGRVLDTEGRPFSLAGHPLTCRTPVLGR